MDDRLAESLQVLRAMGEHGWACLLVPSPTSGDWTEAVRDAGWSPLQIEVAEQSGARGQDDVGVVVAREDIPDVMHERFPPGRPLHQLISSHPDADVLRLVIEQAQPWIIGTTQDLPSVTNYTHVVSRQWRWWLRNDKEHLAPGLTELTRSKSPASNVGGRPGLMRRVLNGRLRPYAIHLAYRLPGPLRTRLAERRHLEAVEPNQAHLTHPAFLNPTPESRPGWLNPGDLPPIPLAARSLERLTPEAQREARQFLLEPHDSDLMLDRRMDNHGDELGRTRDAIRTRLAIAVGAAESFKSVEGASGSSVLVDARSLQSPAFGTRGIGRFADSMVRTVRSVVGDECTTLLIDPTLEPLPADIVGDCRTVRCTSAFDGYAAIIQPSPMTATPDPLIPALLAGTPSLALAFDFIPAHHPSAYLSHPAAFAEYAACLDALALYGEFLAISQTTASELRDLLEARGRDNIACEVTWPQSIELDSVAPAQKSRSRTGPIVIMTGDDARKNTFGALAATGAATSGDAPPRDLVVIGMAGQDDRIHHMSIAAAIRPGETRTAGRIDDDELSRTLASADAVVVASFDEGLSLPVIEALRHGTPVIASDIPAHRELIGSGDFLVDAGDLAGLSAAIRRHRGSAGTWRQQRARLAEHQHTTLEETLTKRLSSMRIMKANPLADRDALSRPRIAVMTPWPPQATGVGDFTAATMRKFAELANVTYYTTSDASEGRPLEELPEQGGEFDAVIAVVGNSHFHLTIIETLARLRRCSGVPVIVIAHDTRMVEFYASLRSKAGAEAVMLRGQQERSLDPSFDEQLEDMRLLQNAGLWEVAHLGDRLVLHSIGSADRIHRETGVLPDLLPFAYYRSAESVHISETTRSQARARLEIPDSHLFLASLGYVDTRTKMTDVVVEAAAWLTQWGHRVSLHLVGAASAELERALNTRAHQAAIHDFRITGFADESTYRDYLLAIDLGVQLRISPLLGVSGPLADMAAFGTRAVASRGLAVDISAPPYITQLPDDVSPLLVAEAIENVTALPRDALQIEMQRRNYLDLQSPHVYARQLLALVQEALT